MLEVKSVTKKFGDNVAVSELSLSVAEPQIIGIIGRSGAGKSTFLRIMNRMTDATSGELLVDGTNVLSLKSRAKMDWQRNCAMIFQQFKLVPLHNRGGGQPGRQLNIAERGGICLGICGLHHDQL